VTAAWIQKNDGPKEKLGPLSDKSSPDATLVLPTLTPGTYLVSWRAAGNDGHVMPGQLHFTVWAGGEPKRSQLQ
jgi:methionine-rich copper-binding protein CopC